MQQYFKVDISKTTHAASRYTCQHLPAYDMITNIPKPSVAYTTVFFESAAAAAAGGSCGSSLAVCSVCLFVSGCKHKHSSYIRCVVPLAERIKSKILDSTVHCPSALQFIFHWPKQCLWSALTWAGEVHTPWTVLKSHGNLLTGKEEGQVIRSHTWTTRAEEPGQTAGKTQSVYS